MTPLEAGHSTVASAIRAGALSRHAELGPHLQVSRARCSDTVDASVYWPWRHLLGASFRLAAPLDPADSPLADPLERLHAAAGEISRLARRTAGSS